MKTHATRAIVLGGTVLMSASTPALAQEQPAQSPLSELTLERLVDVEVQTVFGASRYLQKVTDAPADVSIVTKEEIERFGYQTLADVLRGVRGFYVTNDRNYTYLGVRGFNRPGDYNSRILVFVDGHRLNETIYDLAYIGTEFPIDIDLIERVEIVRGPSSSLYGTSAFFAVVNVITKRAATLHSVQATLEGGTLATRSGGVTFGHETADGSEIVLGASKYASHGASRYTVPGFGTTQDMDSDGSWSAFGSLGRKGWTFEAVYASRNKQIPTGAFGIALDDPRSQTDDERGYLDVRYDGAWRGTTVGWHASYDHSYYRGEYAFGSNEDGRRLSADYARADWWSTDVMLTRRIARRHFLTGGVEYRNNFRQDQTAYDDDPLEPYFDDRRSSYVAAVYVQDEFTIHPRFTLNAGLRHDEYSASRGSTNLRLAAILKPFDGAALKLLHGSAFRAPSPYELYYYPNVDGLVPETIRTSEIVWEQYAQRRFRVSASAFLYRARNLISQMPSPDALDGFVFANVDSVSASGLELEAEYAWRAVNALASYTFEDVHSEPGDQPLSNSPRHLSRMRVTGPIVPRLLFFGAEALYTGDRLTLAGAVADGAFLGNLTLSTRELSRAKLSLTVGNLFNRFYVDPGAEEHPGDVIEQPGRTVRAKVSWRF